jgi:hypothetical protein
MAPMLRGQPFMGSPPERSSKRVLEPIERISEVLFGVIMVLTFTGSLSAAESGRAEVRAMFLGALGCNLAWGLIDGIMYLMACVTERAQQARTVQAIRAATSPEAAWRAIAGELPPVLSQVLSPADIEGLRLRLNGLPEPPRRARLSLEDWRGAAAVWLLVFLSTVPVILPFLFVHEPVRALRISNAIAVGLLFVTGFAVGRLAGHRPWVTGVSMVLLGAALVGITMALGG